MKKLAAIAVLSAGIFTSCGSDTTSTSREATESKTETLQSDAAKYQQELSAFYNNPATTPLSEQDKKQFKGIKFFPINDKYRVEARFTPIENGRIIPFTTSSNSIKEYRELGTASFTIDNKEQTLTLYEPAQTIAGAENLVFIPFKDATSGLTSYGAGRYLELDKNDLNPEQTLIMDFNKAYNPYCAYSDDYNCPLPPAENTLSVKIEAGVRYDYLPQ